MKHRAPPRFEVEHAVLKPTRTRAIVITPKRQPQPPRPRRPINGAPRLAMTK
jgi:hypothetical protein